MSLLPSQDVSLYQLVLNTEPDLQPLSVSPATLKTLLESLIDVLIEQKIGSELWIKLPPGEIWKAEIERYHKQVGIAHTIYVCATPSGETNPHPDSRKTPLKLKPSPADSSQIVPVQLALASHLRREYFLLLLSDRFCGLILANRPAPDKHLVEATGKRHKLLAICSFDLETVQRVLQKIKSYLVGNVATERLNDEVIRRNPLPVAISSSTAPTLLAQLLAKQVQRQEGIRQQVESDRALVIDRLALQQQNQVLLNNLHLKDEFLEHVAQEMRTPLTNMKTAMKLIEAANLKPAQRQRYMQLLRTECDRQSSLINRLLEMVELERLGETTDKQLVHLADVIPGVVSTYQAIAQEKGIQLAYTVSPSLPAVSCFEAWIRQIIINLLHNSIKFTPNGGQVWVRTKQQGDYVQMEVRDTGIGIAPHELLKIFDRFYRGRPAMGEESTGAGLGLTIVQQILLRCGGSITVTSRLGEGSAFKVLLPIESSTT